MTTPEEITRIEQEIVLTLKNIYDPEIPVNIYDLGLVYEIDVEPDGVANIRMTLTAPNCPMADQLLEEVHDNVAKIKGIVSRSNGYFVTVRKFIVKSSSKIKILCFVCCGSTHI